MKMVLLHIRKALEETVIPMIQQEIANSSAREHLGEIQLKITHLYSILF